MSVALRILLATFVLVLITIIFLGRLLWTSPIQHRFSHHIRPAVDRPVPSRIPQFVLDFAPLVHLHTDESFWPCGLNSHLIHTTPHLNFTPLQPRDDHPDLSNLDKLNRWPPDHGADVYLQSDDDVETRPDWLSGASNIPSMIDYRPPQSSQRFLPSMKAAVGGRSAAPAVLVLVSKPNSTLDAFWFFFYSYNQGPTVLNTRFGNHVGDWEHTLVRFQNSTPTTVFLSEHFFGEAYTYDAMEKIRGRPVVYSAIGTHAMYGTAGRHPYILPLGLLHDETSDGPLWDPALNMMTYTYNVSSEVLTPGDRTPEIPTGWFFFNGRWGDKSYPSWDERQYEWGGQRHYVDGPKGPLDKNLGRNWVCQSREGPGGRCEIMGRLKGEKVKDFSNANMGDGHTAWEDL